MVDVEGFLIVTHMVLCEVLTRFKSGRCATCLMIFLLSIQALLLAWGAYIHSPTLNEPSHLVGGISIWQFRQFSVYQVNPPLVRMVAAIPVLSAGVKTDWHNHQEGPGIRHELPIGEDFVAANGERSFFLFTLARWVCIPFSLVGGYVCFCWARELYGVGAGLLALTLWCFSPSILGHGQLITCDVAAAGLGLTACYAFWHWLIQPTWWHTLLSGIFLGIAELAKTTLVIFLLLWPLLWLIYRWADRRELRACDWLRELGMLAVQMVVVIWTINLGYAFEGSGTRLRDFRFVSAALGAKGDAEEAPPNGCNRFAQTWLGILPMPLPMNYVLGIDLQKRDFEQYSQPSYLRGQFSTQGWWYYYLYALIIKVPLGTWLLIGLAATTKIFSKVNVRLRDEFILLAPTAIILTFVSSQSKFSQHMRYVLPAFPFVFIWMGRVTVVFNWRHRALAGMVLIALAWSISSSLWVYPHSLSYFNELVGGPSGGSEHLIHSNIDWGQDLLILKHWLNDHPQTRPLSLAYFGGFDPKYAGIEYTALPDVFFKEHTEDSDVKIPPGWYAISVNFVRGFPYLTFTGNGMRGSLHQDALAAFKRFHPVAMAGYSIYIYHITEEKTNQARRELGLPELHAKKGKVEGRGQHG